VPTITAGSSRQPEKGIIASHTRAEQHQLAARRVQDVREALPADVLEAHRSSPGGSISPRPSAASPSTSRIESGSST
jgi:hypothetical protein